MDRRQRKTRKAIFDAFTKLLEDKSYSGITVQEIIDEADISRSTFYSHFETKDELLRELCTEIFEHVFSDHISKEKSHDFSGSDNDLKEEITHMLYHLQDNNRFKSYPFLRERRDIHELFQGIPEKNLQCRAQKDPNRYPDGICFESYGLRLCRNSTMVDEK